MYKKFSLQALFSTLTLSTFFCLTTLAQDPENPDWRDAAIGTDNSQIENTRASGQGQLIATGQALAMQTFVKTPTDHERELQDAVKRMDRDEALRRYSFPLGDKDLAQLREKAPKADPYDFTILSSENQEFYKRFKHKLASPLSSKDEENRLPVYTTNRIILHGPSGNGKTEFVRALAETTGAHYIHIPTTDLVTKWQGSGSENVNLKIEDAIRDSKAKGKRVFLLFDEIDIIAAKKDGFGGDTHQAEKAATAALWQQLDKHRNNGRLWFFCATNGFDTVDERLRNRSSAIKFDSPEHAQRAQLLKFWLKHDNIDLATVLKLKPKQAESLIQDLASRTGGFPARSMAQLVHGFKEEIDYLTSEEPSKINKQLLYNKLTQIRENIFANALEQARSTSVLGYRPLAWVEGKIDYLMPAIRKYGPAISLISLATQVAPAVAALAGKTTWLIPPAIDLASETAGMMYKIIFARR